VWKHSFVHSSKNARVCKNGLEERQYRFLCKVCRCSYFWECAKGFELVENLHFKVRGYKGTCDLDQVNRAALQIKALKCLTFDTHKVCGVATTTNGIYSYTITSK
jgi:hypothetical protein